MNIPDIPENHGKTPTIDDTFYPINVNGPLGTAVGFTRMFDALVSAGRHEQRVDEAEKRLVNVLEWVDEWTYTHDRQGYVIPTAYSPDGTIYVWVSHARQPYNDDPHPPRLAWSERIMLWKADGTIHWHTTDGVSVSTTENRFSWDMYDASMPYYGSATYVMAPA